MKSKVIEGEESVQLEACTGHGYGHDTRVSLAPTRLQFDSEGLRRWIPRRPSLERGKERERVGRSELARPRVSLQLPQIPRY